MKVIRLEDNHNEIFEQICLWYYNWLGKKNHESFKEIKATFSHSLNINKLPQTYIAYKNHQAVGMYQIAMMDDLTSRPDLYPWLINLYVDEHHRNQGVCRKMMESVYQNMEDLKINKLYLYTEHNGLYEKFDWKYLNDEYMWKDNKKVRLYELTINKGDKDHGKCI